MKRPQTIIATGLIIIVLGPLLAACGAMTTASTQPQTTAVAATATPPPPTPLPTTEPAPPRPRSISGIGQIIAAREASLSFMTSGQIVEVRVEEGAQVKQGDVLAVLDMRQLDSAIQQAEAAVASAKAQQTALTDAPRPADVRVARAQVRQAEISLAQARNSQTQTVRSSESSLNVAQTGLQQTRDQLSAAKTQAETGVSQATQALIQAQAAYAKAKSDWEFVQDTGNDPQQPSVGVNPQTGEKIENNVENSQRETYYAAFVQAEAALRTAEQAVQQAQVDFDTARQAEITGIASAEQQVVQAQAGLDQVRVPEGESQVALAQANVELAQAQLAQLNPSPTQSQKKQVAAAIAQAEAALTQARLNREYGELRAPFDGLVTTMAIESGEVVAPGTPVIDMFDTSSFRFEAPIADFDITRVQQGQQVRIRVDALPEELFTGAVSYISPSVTTQGNVRTYTVRVDLEDAEGVRVGMSGQMVLETR